MIKKVITSAIPQSKKRGLKKKLRKIIHDFKSIGNGANLNRLAIIYGTDKNGAHFYTPNYKTHFQKYRSKRINLLEIGVGGYHFPNAGGNSLRMWKRYFPFGKIFSLDIHDKSALQERRIKIFKGSQVDKEFLETVTAAMGTIDIIIDDGSHINEHVIETFKLLFPKLKDGGIYVVEDTQTSYWKEYGGDSTDLNNSRTMMNFFKSLTDSLNYGDFENEGYEPTYYDKKIISMHFYHNMVFIYKGNND